MSSMTVVDFLYFHMLYQTLTSIKVVCLHIAMKINHLQNIHKNRVSTSLEMFCMCSSLSINKSKIDIIPPNLGGFL